MGLFQALINLIYPPQCRVCRKFLQEEYGETEPDGFICKACLSAFIPLESPHCPICGRSFSQGISENHVCENCLRKRPFFDWAGAPYLFEDGLMEAIHQFKYGGKSYLAKSLGPLLKQYAGQKLPAGLERGLVMPIPLHPKRLRERGFNQSLLLARYVAELPELELDYLNLRRARYTQPQTGLKGDERRKNVRRAFKIEDKTKVRGRVIILVDDVLTTGSTLNECARILKQAGANKVFGLALASTVTGFKRKREGPRGKERVQGFKGPRVQG
jgi:ComF family protein